MRTVAWLRGIKYSAGPSEPDEYDEECYPGEDAPDDSPGWTPLVTRKAADEAISETRMKHPTLDTFLKDKKWTLHVRMYYDGRIQADIGEHHAQGQSLDEALGRLETYLHGMLR